jgi:hypothetical protein
MPPGVPAHKTDALEGAIAREVAETVRPVEDDVQELPASVLLKTAPESNA